MSNSLSEEQQEIARSKEKALVNSSKMTVGSLWTVLEQARCAVPVNASTFRQQCKTVAIDLSIWICEALTSSSLNKFHSNPVLNLVYRRIVKLLKLGITPIAVIEGRKRHVTARASNGNEEPTNGHATTRQRRTGTEFDRACQECEQLLQMLGVPVAKAQAEAEALCALLNAKGVVDGVITNDGDCFLYGGIVLYTNFSIDNLEKGQVFQFDARELCAVCVPETADEDEAEKNDEHHREDDRRSLLFRPATPCSAQQQLSTIPLSRNDLIAFALLTGSDLFGDGVPCVGYKKAIRFIQGAKNRSSEAESATASLQLLRSWRDEAAVGDEPEDFVNIKTKCCSVCLHKGDCRAHKRQGCPECGTSASTCCIKAAPDERFRVSLNAKVMAVGSRFASENLISCYNNPNDGVMANSRNRVSRPNAGALMQSALIISGQSLESNRDYVWKSLSKLLARLDIVHYETHGYHSSSASDGVVKPTPIKVVKRLTHESQECYEVLWSIQSSELSNRSSIGEAGTFTTFEWRSLIERRFPNLIQAFQAEQRCVEQRRAEHDRRVLFLGASTLTNKAAFGAPICLSRGSKRLRIFGDTINTGDRPAVKNRRKPDDVVALLRFASHSAYDSAYPNKADESSDDAGYDSDCQSVVQSSSSYVDDTRVRFSSCTQKENCENNDPLVNGERCEAQDQGVAYQRGRREEHVENNLTSGSGKREFIPLGTKRFVCKSMGIPIIMSPIVSRGRR